jgi:hypothetical protein
MNKKESFQIRDRIRDQSDRRAVGGLERTDRGELRNDPHGLINWSPRTMDGLTTDVRSDVEQVDARLAQEMSQTRIRCAERNTKPRRFDALVTSHRAVETSAKDEFFPMRLGAGLTP